MKKFIAAVSVLTVLFLTGFTPVFAQNYGLQRVVNQASKSAARADSELANIKKRADAAIDKRVTDLNSALQKIQGDKKLTSDEKSSLSGDIQTAISGLTSLKTKIDGDTDVATARADAKKIVSDYRVYLVLEPKTRLLITIDTLQKLDANLQGLTPKVQDLINKLKGEGKDTSKLQSLLDDANSKLTTINTQLSTDKSKVQATSISDVNGAHSTFVSVRQDLANVRSQFASVRADIAQMRDQFRIILKGQGANSTPSATNK